MCTKCVWKLVSENNINSANVHHVRLCVCILRSIYINRITLTLEGLRYLHSGSTRPNQRNSNTIMWIIFMIWRRKKNCTPWQLHFLSIGTSSKLLLCGNNTMAPRGEYRILLTLCMSQNILCEHHQSHHLVVHHKSPTVTGQYNW